MTTETNSPRAQEAAAWEACHLAAVDVLTRASRLTVTDGAGRVRRRDLAEFAAHVLVSVAANLGSVDELLAGRTGSWEADLVRQLVTSTVGTDAAALLPYAVEPVVLTLDVTALVESEGPDGLLPCWLVVEAVGHDAATRDAVTEAYRRDYTDYGNRFTEAVAGEAARLGIGHLVTVQVLTDPDASTDVADSHACAGGVLAGYLWRAGLVATGFPQVSLPIDVDRVRVQVS